MKSNILKSLTAVFVAASLFLASCSSFTGTDWQTTTRSVTEVAVIVLLDTQGASAAAYAKQALPIAQTVAALATGDTTPTIEMLQQVLAKYLSGPGSNVVTQGVAAAVISGFTWINNNLGTTGNNVKAGLAAISEGVADACAFYTSVPEGLRNQAATTAKPTSVPATIRRHSK